MPSILRIEGVRAVKNAVRSVAELAHLPAHKKVPTRAGLEVNGSRRIRPLANYVGPAPGPPLSERG
jgi:hypothetical protein